MKLNSQQQQAIHYLSGPLFVLAGAGSGKTRVITEKIAYMIQNGFYLPHQIAAITFTNKAAKEMQERVGKMLSKKQTRGLTVCTFHSLGMKMLREDAEFAGLKKNFSILDASDCAKIIGEILTEQGHDNNKQQIFQVQQQISLWKNDLLSEDAVAKIADAGDAWQQFVAPIFLQYQQTLQHYHAVDFDDLIRLPTLLLRDNSELRYKWQLKFRYLLVDECQDTNTCQYALMKLLTGADGKFTAVGDDDQSIYAWRGANMENLRLLQSDYPNLHIIKLEQNYRSTSRILKIANQVIQNNPKLFPKTLWSQLGQGELVKVVACDNEQKEAQWVVNQIVKQHRVSEGKTQYADFAILYRGNHQARVFEEALRSARVPYQIAGGQSFFDKAEIKDVLSYVRLIANADDDPAFLRAITTPKRGIGDATLGKLNQYAQEHQCSLYETAQSTAALSMLDAAAKTKVMQFMHMMNKYTAMATSTPAGQLMQELLAEIEYERHLLQQEEGKSGEIRWQNVQDLCAWLAEKGEEDEKNIIEIAQTIALMTLLEGKKDEDSDAVKLSTLHASKGLEYPFVFLVGCEEDIFPHAESVAQGNLEEERRLMYVGITRAKRQLTLTHCLKRKRQGILQSCEPSRFIDEMPQDELKIIGRHEADSMRYPDRESRLQNIADLRKLLKKPSGE